jgi:outer membrane protein OmpA-like peptidoglycan-associated protein
MAKKAACRCKAQECEECPEWIFTFADLVMLMMGFFVILWVLKPAATPNIKGGEAAQSDSNLIKVEAAIREAFGYVPDPASSDPVDMQMMIEKIEKMNVPNGPGKGGQTKIKREGAEGTDPEVTTIRVGKQSVVGGRLLFEKGETTLSPAALKMLDQIAVQIRGHRNVVLVKGHTSLDDLPDGADSDQRMELSLKRAQYVASYLIGQGVSPDILRVQGCSNFEPVIQREYTSISQVMNRRVEVEVTRTLVADLQQSEDTPPPPATEILPPEAVSPTSKN